MIRVGFSTSGSAVVVFIGLAIIGNMVFSGSMNGLETVNEARAEETDGLLELQSAAIEFDRARLVLDTLHIWVNNTGGDDLSVTGTTVLVNGQAFDPVTTRVRGDRTTEIWAPGETLYIVIQDDSFTGLDSARFRVVTERGIAISVEVSL